MPRIIKHFTPGILGDLVNSTGQQLVEKYFEFGALQRLQICGNKHFMILTVKDKSETDLNCYYWQCVNLTLCPDCGKPPIFHSENSSCNNAHLIVYPYNLSHYYTQLKCRYHGVSIRYKTIYARDYSISISQILRLMYMWTLNTDYQYVMLSCNIKCKKTVLDWSCFLREIVFDYMVELSVPIGGKHQIIDLTESKFGVRKHYKTTVDSDSQWVYVGIEKMSGKFFVCEVSDNSSRTLRRVIRKWIRPKTLIHTDCYTKIFDGTHHKTINHYIISKVNFDNRSNFIRFYKARQHYTKNNGTSKHFYAGYLTQYLFLRYISITEQDKFYVLLYCYDSIYGKYPIDRLRYDRDDPDFEF